VAGFTLVELMVTISVLAILVGLSMPSFGEVIAKQRLKASASDLQLALLQTRSEAVKRNTSVTLASLDASWTSGWKILDPAGPTANPALETWSAPGKVIVTATPPIAAVVYHGNGRVGTTVAFTLTTTATTLARCVYVAAGGRPYAKVSATC
jgi:type IV fimbrial biogenesis protein FimT